MADNIILNDKIYNVSRGVEASAAGYHDKNGGEASTPRLKNSRRGAEASAPGK